MAQILLTKPKTRYYRRRLWKVSWALVNLPRNRQRVVKHYERRAAIGQEWEYVRSAVYET